MKPLIDMVKGRAKLVHVKDEALWYETDCGDPSGDSDFLFPIPYTETVGATFLPSDRASIFMRWIRKERERQEIKEIEIAEARKLFDTETVSHQDYLARNNGRRL